MEKVKINLGKVLGPRGERGPQGIQGDPGFSPVISIEKDTEDEFVLRIINKGSSFLSPNLIKNFNEQLQQQNDKITLLEQRIAQLEQQTNL